MLSFVPAQGALVPFAPPTGVPLACPLAQGGRLPIPTRIGARMKPCELKRHSSPAEGASALGFGAPVSPAASARPGETAAASFGAIGKIGESGGGATAGSGGGGGGAGGSDDDGPVGSDGEAGDCAAAPPPANNEAITTA